MKNLKTKYMGIGIDNPIILGATDMATVVQGLKYSDYEEQIKEAAESCPVEVIKYTE